MFHHLCMYLLPLVSYWIRIRHFTGGYTHFYWPSIYKRSLKSELEMEIPSHAISSLHISFPFPPSAKLVVAVLSDFQCLKICLRLPFCLPRSGKPVLSPQYIWNLIFCICPTHTSIPRLWVGSDTNFPRRRVPLPSSSICFSLQARIGIEVIILPGCLFFWGELNVK